jgi:hypothetical protein
LELEPLLADGRERAHRAGQLTAKNAGPELGEPLQVSIRFRHPHGELIAERDRQRLLPVGAACLHGVAVAARQGGEKPADLTDVSRQDGVAGPELQDEAGVENVLGGRTPVDEVGRRRLAGAPQAPDEWHDRVAGELELPPHLLEVEELDAGLPADLGRCRGRDDSQPGLGAGERGLDVEPALDHRAVAPHLAHLGGGVEVSEERAIDHPGHWISVPVRRARRARRGPRAPG